MNNFKAVGRLGKKPTIEDKGGKAFCKFSLACPRSGKKDSEVDWIDFVAWEQGAKFLCAYADKGDEVFVSAHWRTNKNQKDGKYYDNSGFVAENVQIVSAARKGVASNSGEQKTSQMEEAVDLGLSGDLPDNI